MTDHKLGQFGNYKDNTPLLHPKFIFKILKLT